jgi:hypothetical protein
MLAYIVNSLGRMFVQIVNFGMGLIEQGLREWWSIVEALNGLLGA